LIIGSNDEDPLDQTLDQDALEARSQIRSRAQRENQEAVFEVMMQSDMIIVLFFLVLIGIAYWRVR
jgi:hypothetical protein